MSRSVSQSDTGAGDFLLIASGQTLYAPYLTDWREFKDHIRKAVREQPGWTNIVDGQRRGEVEGWCKLRDQEDAEAVYSMCGIFDNTARTVLIPLSRRLFQISRDTDSHLCNERAEFILSSMEV
jgi:hypothetical protein